MNKWLPVLGGIVALGIGVYVWAHRYEPLPVSEIPVPLTLQEHAGNVKSVVYTAYHVCSERSELLLEDYTTYNNVEEQRYTATYDSAGNKLSEVYVAESEEDVAAFYEYDSSNRLITITSAYERSKDTIRIEKEYNGQGKVSVEQTYSKAGHKYTTLYVYDDKMRKIGDSCFDNRGALLNYTTYLYNGKGECVEKRQYLSTDTNVGVRTKYEYNHNGCVNRQVELRYINGKMTSECVDQYERNESGKVVNTMRIVNYAGESKPRRVAYDYAYEERGNVSGVMPITRLNMQDSKKKKLFSYKYDKKGNWTEKIQYYVKEGHKVPVRRTVVEISYY